MPRIIDADVLLKRICELCGENCEMPNEAVTCIEWEFAHDAIETLPTVDAVEVVRCKDCVYYNAKEGFCEYLSNNYAPAVDMEEDDFCSKGKRRKDE